MMQEETDSNEPTFTLFASDPMAPKLVRLWAAQKYIEHEDPMKVEEARVRAEEMDRWREQHGKGSGQ